MKSYLKNQKQKVQINNKISSERDVVTGVPQGSIDVPLLLNFFTNDLILFIQACTLSNLPMIMICLFLESHKIYGFVRLYDSGGLVFCKSHDFKSEKMLFYVYWQKCK